MDKLGVDVREVSLDYAVGDNVQIMNGPLEGFIGIVEDVYKRQAGTPWRL